MSPALLPAAAARPGLVPPASAVGGRPRSSSGGSSGEGRRAGPREAAPQRTPGRSGGAEVEPIRVAVRLRPLREDAEGEAGERAEGREPSWQMERAGEQHWVCLASGTPRSPNHGGACSSSAPRPGHERARFCVDFCFDGRASNREVFDAAARDVVRAALDGVNATVLAYGQTNSGKTHSILGTLREPGVLPLAVHDLFGTGGGLRAAGLVARLSYFEIFNERVIDLLAGGHGEKAHLPVKEDVDRGFYVQGLSETPVHSAKDVLRLIERGEDRRRYAQTRWNEYSSRSHVLFTLTLERLPTLRGPGDAAGDQDAGGPFAVGQLAKVSIVDLAGCENHKFEPSEDGRYINRSLFFLGEVISRLCSSTAFREGRDGRCRRAREASRPRRTATPEVQAAGAGAGQEAPAARPGGREAERAGGGAAPGGAPTGQRTPSRSRERSDFIPYRDSKLTRILRSSLGGNAVTLLLVTLHPAARFVEQSMTSLRFATKARCVENLVTPEPPPPAGGDQQTMISAQQRIIEGLQHQLRRLELQRGPAKPPAFEAGQGAERRAGAEQEGRGAAGPWDGRARGGDGLFQDMVDNGFLEQWMVQQFQGLRHELEAKEQQLAAKTRLLSEREWQLGQLREWLGGHPVEAQRGAAEQPSAESWAPQWRSGSPGYSPLDAPPQPSLRAASPSRQPHGPASEVRSQAHACEGAPSRPRSPTGMPPRGAPDEGASAGGLRAQMRALPPEQPQLAGPSHLWPQAQAPAGRGGASEAAPADAGAEGGAELPSAFQQVQSRAEDIVCLRSSYVSRQQRPLGRQPAPAPAPAPGPPGAEADAGPESQKELVEKLLCLAVMQINSVRGAPAQPEAAADAAGPPPPPRAGGGAERRAGPGAQARAGGPQPCGPRDAWGAGRGGPEEAQAPPARGTAPARAPEGQRELPPSNTNVEGTPRRARRGFEAGGGEQDAERNAALPLSPPLLELGRPRGLAP